MTTDDIATEILNAYGRVVPPGDVKAQHKRLSDIADLWGDMRQEVLFGATNHPAWAALAVSEAWRGAVRTAEDYCLACNINDKG